MKHVYIKPICLCSSCVTESLLHISYHRPIDKIEISEGDENTPIMGGNIRRWKPVIEQK